MKRKIVVLMAIMAMACWTGAAGADTTATYYLTVENTGAIQTFDPPYGQVTVTLTSPIAATFAYTTLAPAPFLTPAADAAELGYTFIGNNLLLANVTGALDGANIDTVSNLVVRNDAGTDITANSTYTVSIIATGNVGAAQGQFGLMSLAISGPNDTNITDANDADQVSFTLTRNDGGQWDSVSTGTNPVLTPAIHPGGGATTFVVEGHMFPDFDSGNTFFAGNGPMPVSIPPSALLLGSGLVGLVGLRRFKKS